MARVENDVLHLDRFTVLKGDENYWSAEGKRQSGAVFHRWYVNSVPSGSIGYNSTTKKLLSCIGFVPYVEENSGAGSLVKRVGTRNTAFGEGDVAIVDNYESTSGTDCISAAKGKDLNDRLSAMENIVCISVG